MRMLLLCYDIWWVWKKKKIDCIIARKGFELFFFLCHMKWCAMVPELTGRGSHLAHSSTLSFIEWCPYPKCGSTCGHGSRVGINVSQPLHTECILCRPFKRLKEKNNVYDMWMFYLHFFMFLKWKLFPISFIVLYRLTKYLTRHLFLCFKTTRMMSLMVLLAKKTRVGSLHLEAY
jgi:hypothetical protein